MIKLKLLVEQTSLESSRQLKRFLSYFEDTDNQVEQLVNQGIIQYSERGAHPHIDINFNNQHSEIDKNKQMYVFYNTGGQFGLTNKDPHFEIFTGGKTIELDMGWTRVMKEIKKFINKYSNCG